MNDDKTGPQMTGRTKIEKHSLWGHRCYVLYHHQKFKMCDRDGGGFFFFQHQNFHNLFLSHVVLVLVLVFGLLSASPPRVTRQSYAERREMKTSPCVLKRRKKIINQPCLFAKCTVFIVFAKPPRIYKIVRYVFINQTGPKKYFGA